MPRIPFKRPRLTPQQRLDRINQLNQQAQQNATAQTRTFSRPEGTPQDRNVETTNLSKQEADKVKFSNAVEGQTRKKIEAESVQSGIRAEVAAENVSPQQKDLDEKQKEELAGLNVLLKENGFEEFQKALGKASPEVQSILKGVTVRDEFGNIVGGEQPVTLGQQALGAVGEAAGGLALAGAVGAAPVIVSNLGAAGTLATKISGWGSLFIGGGLATGIGLLTRGKQSQLEGDITDLTSASKTIASDVKNGADSEQAIATLQTMEANMIDMLGKLHVSIVNDPVSKLTGKDIEEFAFKNLNTITRRRQALERFQLDGDLAALQSVLGSDFPTDAAQ